MYVGVENISGSSKSVLIPPGGGQKHILSVIINRIVTNRIFKDIRIKLNVSSNLLTKANRG